MLALVIAPSPHHALDRMVNTPPSAAHEMRACLKESLLYAVYDKMFGGCNRFNLHMTLEVTPSARGAATRVSHSVSSMSEYYSWNRIQRVPIA